MNNFDNRRYVLLLIFISVAVIFIVRLSYMQLITDKWFKRAIEISEYKIYTYPPRGIIYDRYGNKLVENTTYYDLMVKASEVDPEMNEKDFCKILGISEEEFSNRLNEAKDKYNTFCDTFKEIKNETKKLYFLKTYLNAVNSRTKENPNSKTHA